MCPFVTRMNIPVKEEIHIDCYNENVGIGFPCIEGSCMAWVSAKLKIGTGWYHDEHGILTMSKGEEYQPGYCKLIGGS